MTTIIFVLYSIGPKLTWTSWTLFSKCGAPLRYDTGQARHGTADHTQDIVQEITAQDGTGPLNRSRLSTGGYEALRTTAKDIISASFWFEQLVEYPETYTYTIQNRQL